MAACRDFLEVCNFAFQLQRSPDVDPLVWQLAARIDRAMWELDDLQGGTTETTPYPPLSGPLAGLSDAALMGYARSHASVDATVRNLMWCLSECHTQVAEAAEVLGACGEAAQDAESLAEAKALRGVAVGEAFTQVAALWNKKQP